MFRKVRRFPLVALAFVVEVVGTLIVAPVYLAGWLIMVGLLLGGGAFDAKDRQVLRIKTWVNSQSDRLRRRLLCWLTVDDRSNQLVRAAHTKPLDESTLPNVPSKAA